MDRWSMSPKIVYLDVLDGNIYAAIIEGISGHSVVYTAKVIFHIQALLLPVRLEYEKIHL